MPEWFVLWQVAELIIGLVTLRHWRDKRNQEILLGGRNRPKAIPALDKHLAKLAGHPSSLERGIATLFVRFSRQAVKTKAYEHAVLAVVADNSPLGKLRKKKKPSSRANAVRVL